MPPVTANKLPPPAVIPEEWQKANEALEAVAPKSGNSEKTESNKTEQIPVIDLTGNNYDWQNTYTGYPGYVFKSK